MAKRQTRRTISVKAQTYVRVTRLAERFGKSVSGVLEELIETACDREAIPTPTRAEALQIIDKAPKADDDPKNHPGSFFTF